jgi:Icc protein
MEAGGEEIVLFDVSSGDVTGEDLDWLAGVLARRGREEVLLFMHYPPVRLPIAHMERNYALAGREKVSRVMEESQARLYIFCGHYHNELSQERRGYSVFLTPSTYFQIDPMDEEFSIEHHRPGWRFIDRIDGYITTGVRYRGL